MAIADGRIYWIMRRHRKALAIVLFLLALGSSVAFFREAENNHFLGCPLVSREEMEVFINEKQPMEIPEDLLSYQGQPIPFRKDSNLFLIPAEIPQEGKLGCMGYGQIYLIAADSQDFSSFPVYVVNGSSYFETAVEFTSAAIMEFQTDAFERENAYGTMKLYTPVDDEIDTYSFKSSEAKLSYEVENGLTPKRERNVCFFISRRWTFIWMGNIWGIICCGRWWTGNGLLPAIF